MAKLKNKPSDENQKLINEYIDVRKSKQKSNNTIENDRYALWRFALFLKDKNLKDATEKDLQDYFTDVTTLSTYNIFGIQIMTFYKWLFKTKKNERPKNLEWFEFKSKDDKKRQGDAEGIENELISTDDYNAIIEHFETDYMKMWTGLFETFYLSGGRLEEIQSMNINDVIIDDCNVSIRLRKSKTVPRIVPLCQTPEFLIRWLNNHPLRNNPDAPLWISLANKNFGERLGKGGIQQKFWLAKKELKLNDKISIHSFRKTRATIMFNNPEIGNDDKLMAEFFGWKPNTVVERREQYDGRTKKELMDKIFKNNIKQVETYDIIKQQKERLETKHQKEIEQLKKQLDDLKVAEHDRLQEQIDIQNYKKMMDKRFEELADKLLKL